MARPFKGVTFWDRVYSQVEQQGDCLVFTGCKDACGYGRINKDGKLVRLHRAVWERENGYIPTGTVIMHMCDVPACINPKHLVLGTQKMNMVDCALKNRKEHGTQKHNAKLTEEKVVEIRRKMIYGATNAALGREYGVSATVMSHIRHRQKWKHVNGS